MIVKMKRRVDDFAALVYAAQVGQFNVEEMPITHLRALARESYRAAAVLEEEARLRDASGMRLPE